MALFSQNGLIYVVCLSHLTHCPRESASVWICILAIYYLCIAMRKRGLSSASAPGDSQALAYVTEQDQIPPTVCVSARADAGSLVVIR